MQRKNMVVIIIFDLRKLLLDDYDAPEAYVLVIKGLFKRFEERC